MKTTIPTTNKVSANIRCDFSHPACILLLVVLASCGKTSPVTEIPLAGTWQLVSGTLIEKGDTTFTDYRKNVSMIKVMNESHFAFMNHDLNHGNDSTAAFSAGGGRYKLTGDQYTEHLEYCSAREWEGRDFVFTVSVLNDTLVQQGVEKLEDVGIDRLNIERYVRVKN